MGLPARWVDAEHGLCLSLWAAMTYLQERGLIATVEKTSLYYSGSTHQNALMLVEPVQIAAIGMMYPVRLLDTLSANP
jgi:hypothetical protein